MNIDMSQKKNCKCKIILFKSLIFNEYVISKIHCIYIYISLNIVSSVEQFGELHCKVFFI